MGRNVVPTPAFNRVAARMLLFAAAALPLVSTAACVKQPTAAVTMKVVRKPKTPADAAVIIDEEYFERHT